MRLAILGAGEHGRVTLALARLLPGVEPLLFLDDRAARHGETVDGLPVAGAVAELPELVRRHRLDAAFPAVGDAAVRLAFARAIDAAGLELPTLVHPAAHIDPGARLGRGVIVEACACLTHNPALGDLVIVNPMASINHDNRIGEAAHLAARVALGGAVAVGAQALLGVGATVAPGVRIGRRALVASGAVCLKDVAAGAVVLGNPARRIRMRREDE